MTEEQIALARRAVACRGWRWLPGMLAWRPDCPPIRLAAIEDAGNALQEHRWLPDLTDPATLGCLLALVREVWGEPRTVVEAAKYGWGIVVGGRWIFADTEAEALVAALESAP